MANQKHVHLFKQGVEKWNRWRDANKEVKPDLSNANLFGVNLGDVGLFIVNLRDADLSKADLRGANLGVADLRGANLDRASLGGANLSDVDPYGVCMDGADLSGANLSGANLSGANLNGANLNGANLNGANLSGALLSGANLTEANLSRADLSRADLSGADLSRADLSEADLRNAGLRNAGLDGANLRNALLGGAHLDSADLDSADLRGAKLSGFHTIGIGPSSTYKIGANLTEANLSNADLSNADLSNADLSRAHLSGANLTEANLTEANLSNADLRGANLRSATLRSTIFADTDLRTVKGLVELRHLGPSRVELHTVQLPQDGSSPHFLRGTGVSDEWIDDYRTRMMHPSQYHSLFISCSSKDEVLARRLHADLQDQGVRCWFAPEDMKIGDKIRTRINEAVYLQDKLLLLLSEHSITSTWVEDEVEAALEKEQRQHRNVLFPVRLDESVMKTSQAWAAMLRRSRHIGDFSNWTDPQVYQMAFKRLLDDLKKTDEQQDQETKQ